MSDAAAHARLVQLQQLGVGIGQASKLSGLAKSLLQHIRSADRGKIRAQTEREILNMRAVLAYGARVPAWPTNRLIRTLLGEGYTRGALASKLGLKTPRLQLSHKQITVRNALKVRALYKDITETDDL